MKLLKATSASVDALRRAAAVRRNFLSSGGTVRRSGNFFLPDAPYTGPFRVILNASDESGYPVTLPLFCGGACGLIQGAGFLLIREVPPPSETIRLTVDQSELVLAANFSASVPTLQFYTSERTDRDLLNNVLNRFNPITEEYPHRNPYIAVYSIARLNFTSSGVRIEQIQKGNIIDPNRWWDL